MIQPDKTLNEIHGLFYHSKVPPQKKTDKQTDFGVMQGGRETVLKFEDLVLHLSQGVSPVETQSDTGLPKEDCTPLGHGKWAISEHW